MKKVNESYTVIILPSPTSKPYRFSITKKAIKILIGGLSVTALLLTVFMVQYLSILQDMGELRLLRKENVVQRLQLQTFSTSISDLKKQLTQLRELDNKLRVITDIAPPSQVAQTFGMGGPEELTLADSDLTLAGPNSPEALVLQMQEEVKTLRTAASLQELSFQQLTEAMKDRRSLWASTPSVWPVRGWLTSGFGERVSPFTGNLMMHNGIDVATRRDTPVAAPANGVVSYEGYDNGLGRMVKINHGYGMQTLYGHLAKSNVRVGQRIKRGDVIGFVGNTGLSTGPHLHYEVYINGLPVNPLRYIIN
jgi:murein DD-endopeptidase MepM/ murein hydrolase activator NlpD